MLVLGRKVDEVVVVGEGPDAIRIMVVEIRGDVIRLGFDAPKHIRIVRQEIIKEQSNAAG
jgi:carbon storage regulator